MTSSVQYVAKYFCSASVKPMKQLYFSQRCRWESYLPAGISQVRFMSSNNEDGKNNADSKTIDSTLDSKPPSKSSETSKIAKTKLNDLLQSIVKEAGNRAKSDQNSSADVLDEPLPEKEKPKSSKQSTDSKKKSKGEKQPKEKEIVLGKRILKAVKKVAESIEGDPTIIESELVEKLKSQNNAGKVQLSEVFAGMKIETPKDTPQTASSSRDDFYEDVEHSRAARVRQTMHENSDKRHRQYSGERQREGGSRRMPTRHQYDDMPVQSKTDLFGARPLGIFSKPVDATKKEAPLLITWEQLHAKELKMFATHPPANGFEEMITWTEQGKLWEFPIDNEQGLDEEAKFSFEDHVFLEPYIESWCPPRGPVRSFMELVCVALGKNSYLTVPEKREYLDWYHDYFRGKDAILKEAGTVGVKG